MSGLDAAEAVSPSPRPPVLSWTLSVMPRAATAFVSAAVSISAAAHAQCSFEFADFSQPKGVVISGGAVPVDVPEGTGIRLTTSSPTNSGALALADRAPVATFHASFSFRISDPGGVGDIAGQTGADGISLTLAPNALEYPGSGTYGWWTLTDYRLMVHWDTFWNSGDISTNSLRIIALGVTSQVNVPGRFDDGELWTTWLDYDGAVLEVRVSHGSDRPESPTIQRPLDLVGLCGRGDAFASIGAVCDAAWDTHVINSLAWTGTSVGVVEGPTSRASCPTGSAEYSVVAAGLEPFTYQWRWRPAAESTWLDVVNGINNDPVTGLPSFRAVGATESNVTIENLAGASGADTFPLREFLAIISNSCGSDETGTAMLTICIADFNCDGVVNSTDVSDFINQWFEDQVKGTLVTDWDGNGVANSTDVSSFINSWFEDTATGCG
jgi:hypothetical protein